MTPVPENNEASVKHGQSKTKSLEGALNETVKEGQTKDKVKEGQQNTVKDGQSKVTVTDGQQGQKVKEGQPQRTVKAGQPQDIVKKGQPQHSLKNGQPQDTIKEGQPQRTVKAGQPQDTVKAGQPQDTVKDVQSQDTVKKGQPQGTLKNGQPQDAVKDGQPQRAVREGQAQDTVNKGQPQDTVKDGQLQRTVREGKPQDTVKEGPPQDTAKKPAKKEQPQGTVWKEQPQREVGKEQTQEKAKAVQPQEIFKEGQSKENLKDSQTAVKERHLQQGTSMEGQPKDNLKEVQSQGTVREGQPKDKLNEAKSQGRANNVQLHQNLKDSQSAVKERQLQQGTSMEGQPKGNLKEAQSQGKAREGQPKEKLNEAKSQGRANDVHQLQQTSRCLRIDASKGKEQRKGLNGEQGESNENPLKRGRIVSFVPLKSVFASPRTNTNIRFVPQGDHICLRGVSTVLVAERKRVGSISVKEQVCHVQNSSILVSITNSDTIKMIKTPFSVEGWLAELKDVVSTGQTHIANNDIAANKAKENTDVKATLAGNEVIFQKIVKTTPQLKTQDKVDVKAGFADIAGKDETAEATKDFLTEADSNDEESSNKREKVNSQGISLCEKKAEMSECTKTVKKNISNKNVDQALRTFLIFGPSETTAVGAGESIQVEFAYKGPLADLQGVTSLFVLHRARPHSPIQVPQQFCSLKNGCITVTVNNGDYKNRKLKAPFSIEAKILSETDRQIIFMPSYTTYVEPVDSMKVVFEANELKSSTDVSRQDSEMNKDVVGSASKEDKKDTDLKTKMTESDKLDTDEAAILNDNPEKMASTKDPSSGEPAKDDSYDGTKTGSKLSDDVDSPPKNSNVISKKDRELIKLEPRIPTVVLPGDSALIRFVHKDANYLKTRVRGVFPLPCRRPALHVPGQFCPVTDGGISVKVFNDGRNFKVVKSPFSIEGVVVLKEAKETFSKAEVGGGKLSNDASTSVLCPEEQNTRVADNKVNEDAKKRARDVSKDSETSRSESPKRKNAKEDKCSEEVR